MITRVKVVVISSITRVSHLFARGHRAPIRDLGTSLQAECNAGAHLHPQARPSSVEVATMSPIAHALPPLLITWQARKLAVRGPLALSARIGGRRARTSCFSAASATAFNHSRYSSNMIFIVQTAACVTDGPFCSRLFPMVMYPRTVTGTNHQKITPQVRVEVSLLRLLPLSVELGFLRMSQFSGKR